MTRAAELPRIGVLSGLAARPDDDGPYGLRGLTRSGLQPLLLDPARGGARVVTGLGRRWDEAHWGDALRRLNGYDAVLCWDERFGVPAAAAPRRPRRLVTGCIWLTDQQRPAVRAVRMLQRADAVFVLSSAQIAPLAALGVAADRLRHVPFGIDPDRWSPDPSVDRERLVVAVGNDKHRDVATFTAAMELLGRQAPEVQVVTVGSAYPDAAGPVSVHHRWLDAPALQALLRRASAAVVPLRPNLHVSGMTAMLEALACGCPVVTTRTAGVEGYVQAGVTGELVEAGEPQLLAQAVRALIDEPARAVELGAAGRRSVERNHTRRATVDALAGLLHEVLAF